MTRWHQRWSRISSRPHIYRKHDINHWDLLHPCGMLVLFFFNFLVWWWWWRWRWRWLMPVTRPRSWPRERTHTYSCVQMTRGHPVSQPACEWVHHSGNTVLARCCSWYDIFVTFRGSLVWTNWRATEKIPLPLSYKEINYPPQLTSISGGGIWL